MRDRRISWTAAPARVAPLGLVALLVLLAATPSAAQDQQRSIDIEVGSRRIGGPGLTERERKITAWEDSDDVFYTEENLPPQGSKKRLSALHILAKRYFDGQQWKQACSRYDVIVEEAPDDGLASHPEGKKNAARSFYECAVIEANLQEHEKAERLLKKSEALAPKSAKHDALRHKMLRDRYRKKLVDGDLETAMQLFNAFQDQRAHEDERIWFGEQLAALAVQADKSGDKRTRDDLIRKADEIAPMNTELRQLKDQIHTQEKMVPRVFAIGGGALVLLLVGTSITRWRARRKLNRFEVDDPEFELER